MSNKIKVAIRVRSLISREEHENSAIHWKVDEDTIYQIDPETSRQMGNTYKFDHIFNTHMTTRDVFDVVVKPIVNNAVKGFNGTVFAYGQTSSGKTYTMMGNAACPGIIPMAVNHIFYEIENAPDREFLLRVSYMEIYNERIRDLLVKHSKDLKLQEVEQGVVAVKGLTEGVISSPEEVLNHISTGERNRVYGETNMNERSSRSHTIFRIIIESRGREEDADGAVQVSHLNLVDLAGSERASQAGTSGERLKEGCAINRSLLTLGVVISQLSEEHGQFVNFRDSKLTRILQSSLGGNSYTSVICTVTPASVEQTHSTLGFASRAKVVKIDPHVNEVLSNAALLKRYAKYIQQLEQELQKAKDDNRSTDVEEMEKKLQENMKLNTDLQEKISLLKQKLVVSSTAPVSLCKSNRRRTWCAPGRLSLPRLNFKVPLPVIQESMSQSGFERRTTAEDIEGFFPTCDESLRGVESSEQLEQEEVIELEKAFGIAVSRTTTPARRFKQHFSLPAMVNLRTEVACQTEEPAKSQFDVSCQIDMPHNRRLLHLINPPSLETPPRVLRQRNDELKEIVKHWEKEYDELREFTRLEKDVQEESENSPKEVKQLQDRIHNLERSTKDAEGLYLETNKALSQLSQDHGSLKAMHNDLQLRYDSLNEQLKSSLVDAERTSSLTEKVQALQQLLNMREKKIEELENEKHDFDMKLELAEMKHNKQQEELKKYLQEAWDELRVKESLNDNMTKEIEKLRRDSENPRKSLPISSKKERDRILLHEELEKVSNLLKDTETHTSSTTSYSLHEVTDECVEDKQEPNELSGSSVDGILSLKQEIGVLRDRIKDLESVEQTLNSELEKAKCSTQSDKDVICQLNDKISILQQQIEDFEKCMKEKHTELEEVNSCLKEKKEKLEQLVMKEEEMSMQNIILNEELQTKLNILESTKETLTSELEQVKLNAIAMEEHEERMLRLNEEITNLKQCIAESQSCVEEKDKQLEENINLVTELIKKEEVKAIENESLKEELFSLRQQIELLESREETLKVTLEEMKCNTILIADHSDITCKLNNEIDLLKQAIAECERCIEDKNRELEVNKEQLSDLMSKEEAMHSEEHQLKQELAETEQKVKLLENELEKLKSDTISTTEHEVEMNRLKDEMSLLKQIVAESKSSIEGKSTEIEGMKKQLKEWKAKEEVLSLEKDSLIEEVEDLKNELLNVKCNTISKEEHDDIMYKLNDEIVQLRETIEEYEACIQEKNIELEDTKNDLTELIREVAVRSLEEEDLREELVELRKKVKLLESGEYLGEELEKIKESVEQDVVHRLTEEITQLNEKVAELDRCVEGKNRELDENEKLLTELLENKCCRDERAKPEVVAESSETSLENLRDVLASEYATAAPKKNVPLRECDCADIRELEQQVIIAEPPSELVEHGDYVESKKESRESAFEENAKLQAQEEQEMTDLLEKVANFLESSGDDRSTLEKDVCKGRCDVDQSQVSWPVLEQTKKIVDVHSEVEISANNSQIYVDTANESVSFKPELSEFADDPAEDRIICLEARSDESIYESVTSEDDLNVPGEEQTSENESRHHHEENQGDDSEELLAESVRREKETSLEKEDWQEIETLLEKIKLLENSEETMKKELKELRCVATSTAENEDLIHQLHNDISFLKQKIADSERCIQEMNTENTELKEKVKELTKTVRKEEEFSSKVEVMSSEENLKGEEVVALQEKITLLECTEATLKDRLKELQSNTIPIAKHSDEINLLKQTIAKYETCIEEKNRELEDNKQQLADFVRKEEVMSSEQNLKGEIVALQDKITLLECTEATLKDRLDELQSNTIPIAKYSDAIHKLNDEINLLKQTIAKYETCIEEKNRELEDNKQQLADLLRKEEVIALQDKITLLECTEATLKDRLEELQSNTIPIAKHSDAIHKLNDEINLLKQTIAKHETCIEEKNRELEDNKQQLADLVGKGEVVALQDKITLLECTEATLKDRLEELQSNTIPIAKYSDAIHKLNDEINLLKQTIAKYETCIEEKNRELEDNKQQLADLLRKEEVIALQDKITLLECTEATLKDRLEELQSNTIPIAKHSDAIHKLNDEINLLKQTIAKHETCIEEKNSELEDNKQQLADLVGKGEVVALQDKITLLECTEATLKDRLEELQSNTIPIAKYSDAIHKLNDEINLLKQTIAKYETCIEEKNRELEDNKQQLADLVRKEEVVALQDKITLLECTEATLKDRLEELQSNTIPIAKHSDAIHKLNDEINLLKQTIVKYETCIEEKNRELEDNKQQLADLVRKEEVVALQDKITSLECTEATLKDRLEELQSNTIPIAKHSDAIHKLNDEINLLKQTIATCETCIEDKNRELEDNKQQLADLVRMGESMYSKEQHLKQELAETEQKVELMKNELEKLKSDTILISEYEVEMNRLKDGVNLLKQNIAECETPIEEKNNILEKDKQLVIGNVREDGVTAADRALNESGLEENFKLKDLIAQKEDEIQELKCKVAELLVKCGGNSDLNNKPDGTLQDVNLTMSSENPCGMEIVSSELEQAEERACWESRHVKLACDVKVKKNISNMSSSPCRIIREEVESFKKLIIQEIKCLQPSADEVSLQDCSLLRLKDMLLTCIMEKETEMFHNLQEKFDDDKRQFEDELKQKEEKERTNQNWILDLETEVEKLQKEITMRELKIATQNEENISLADEVMKVKTEIETLQDKCLAHTAKEGKSNQLIHQLQSEVSKLSADIGNKAKLEEELRLLLISEKENCTQLRSELKLASEDNREMACYREKLEDALSQQQKSDRDLKQKVNELCDEIAQLKEEISTLKQSIARLNLEKEKEVTSLLQERSLLEEQLEECKMQLKSLSVMNDDNVDVGFSLQTARDVIEERFSKLKNREGILEEELSKVKIAKAEVEEKLRETERKLDTVQVELSNMKQDFATKLSEERAIVEKKLNSVREEMEAELTKVSKVEEARQKDLQLAELKNKLAEKCSENEAILLKMESIGIDIAVARSRISHLEMEKEALIKVKDNLAKKCLNMESQSVRLASNSNECQGNEYEKLMTENKYFSDKVVGLELERMKFLRRIETLEAEISRIQNDSMMADKVEDMEDVWRKRFQQENLDLRRANKKLQSEIKKLENEVMLKERESHQMLPQNVSKAQTPATKDSEIPTLKKEIQELKEKCSELRHRYDSALQHIDHLGKQNEASENKCKAYEVELKLLRSIVDNAKSKTLSGVQEERVMISLQEEIKTLNQKLVQSDKEIEEAVQHIRKLEERYEKKCEEYEEIQEECSELREKNDNALKHINHLRKQNEASENKCKAYEVELKSLRSIVDNAKSKTLSGVQDERAMISSLQEEIKTLNETLAQSEKEIEEAVQHIRKLEERYEKKCEEYEEIQEFKEECSELREKNDNALKHINHLRKQNESSENKCKAYEVELKSLRSIVGNAKSKTLSGVQEERAMVSSLQEEIKTLNETLVKSEEEIEEAVQHIRRLEEKYEKKCEDYESVLGSSGMEFTACIGNEASQFGDAEKSKCDAVKSLNEKLQEDIRMLQEQNDNLSARCNQLQEEVNTLSCCKAKAEQKCTMYAEELESLKSVVTMKSAEVGAEAAARMKSLEVEMLHLKTLLAEAEQERDDYIDSVHRIENEMEKILEDRDVESKGYKMKIEDYEKELNEFRSRNVRTVCNQASCNIDVQTNIANSDFQKILKALGPKEPSDDMVQDILTGLEDIKADNLKLRCNVGELEKKILLEDFPFQKKAELLEGDMKYLEKKVQDLKNENRRLRSELNETSLWSGGNGRQSSQNTAERESHPNLYHGQVPMYGGGSRSSQVQNLLPESWRLHDVGAASSSTSCVLQQQKATDKMTDDKDVQTDPQDNVPMYGGGSGIIKEQIIADLRDEKRNLEKKIEKLKKTCQKLYSENQKCRAFLKSSEHQSAGKENADAKGSKTLSERN